MAFRFAAALAALFLALPASAQDGTVVFRSGERTYRISPPPGYCAGSAFAEQMAGRAGANGEPPLSAVFTRCDTKISLDRVDFVAVKATGSLVPRDTLMRDLRDTIGAAKASDNLVRDDQVEAMRARSRASLAEAKIVPTGIDEMCGYIAGQMTFTMPDGKSIQLGLIGCIASVEGEVMYFFRYDSADIPALADRMPSLRAMAESVRQQ